MFLVGILLFFDGERVALIKGFELYFGLKADDLLPFDQIGQQIIGDESCSVLLHLRQVSFVDSNDEILLISFYHDRTTTIAIICRNFMTKNVILVDKVVTLLHPS